MNLSLALPSEGRTDMLYAVLRKRIANKKKNETIDGICKEIADELGYKNPQSVRNLYYRMRKASNT